MNRFSYSGMICLLLLLSQFVFAQKQDIAVNNNVNNVNNLFDKGNNLLIKEYSNTALGIWQEALEKNSEDSAKRICFNASLAVWKEILKTNPEDPDFNFKTGLCYFSSFDEKTKALPYFRKALKSMTMDYDFKNSKGGKAPYCALYFVAETFLENGQADSALKYFSLYQNQYEVTPISAERDILMCINAKKSINNPRNVKPKNMGKKINTEYAETNPVVKLDNSMLFFSSRRPSKSDAAKANEFLSEDIYIAKDSSGSWIEPQPFRYNTSSDEVPLYITPDGLNLYFRRTIKGNADIYLSKFNDGVWDKPEALTVVNSRYNENGLSISGDGKYLYFSSDRTGGLGKFDIYQCVKASNGEWGIPEGLGFPINTPLDEISPFIDQGGKTLFFSSNGSADKGVGGYDIYYSDLKNDNTWTDPVNMGYPVNKTGNEINYYSADGGKRYYSCINEDQGYDLYEIVGGGFDVEAVAAGTEVVTVTNEMNVTQVMETEKKVEKEVDVVQTVETEITVEKEVEITVEKEVTKEVIKEIAQDNINVGKLDSASRVALVNKVKNYLTQRIKENAKNDREGSFEKEIAKELIKEVAPENTNIEKLDASSKAALAKKIKNYIKQKPKIDDTKEPVTNTEVSVPVREKETSIFKTIYFDFNTSTLSSPSVEELKQTAKFISEHPEIKIEIVGHSDNNGSWEANLWVSEKRAKEVSDFLLKNNISSDRMMYYGKGYSAPIANNDTKGNRSKNRRVEILVLK